MAGKGFVKIAKMSAAFMICCGAVFAGPLEGVAGFAAEEPSPPVCPFSDIGGLFPTNTKEVLNHFRNEQKVMLRGRIVGYVGDEAYEFRDESGTIILTLDRRHDWDHLIMGQRILVYGLVDRDWRRVSIRVHRAGPAEGSAMVAEHHLHRMLPH